MTSGRARLLSTTAPALADSPRPSAVNAIGDPDEIRAEAEIRFRLNRLRSTGTQGWEINLRTSPSCRNCFWNPGELFPHVPTSLSSLTFLSKASDMNNLMVAIGIDAFDGHRMSGLQLHEFLSLFLDSAQSIYTRTNTSHGCGQWHLDDYIQYKHGGFQLPC